jgi:hypothetical protein
MGLFSRTKGPDSGSYDVTSDPSMTRWEQRRCDSCGNRTTHKVARTGRGSSRAVVTCTKCKHWEEESW